MTMYDEDKSKRDEKEEKFLEEHGIKKPPIGALVTFPKKKHENKDFKDLLDSDFEIPEVRIGKL